MHEHCLPAHGRFLSQHIVFKLCRIGLKSFSKNKTSFYICYNVVKQSIFITKIIVLLMLTYSYKIDIFFPHDHNLSVEEILKLAEDLYKIKTVSYQIN